MDNLVLFCKTYKNDFNRFKILKASIDRFNVESLPFYVVCPMQDIELFNSLISGNETYKVKIISDEEVLNANNIELGEQSWQSQQFIKLGFYKLGLCNHYAIFDSDCYFIQNFHFNDFMYDENTPYFYLMEQLVNVGDRDFAKNYIGRKGKLYSFIYNSQVFSKKVLEDMEKNLLNQKKLTLKDLINLDPYEFQWYGEWFLHCGVYQLYPTSGKVKVYWLQEQYSDDRSKGISQNDLVNDGYIAVLLNNGWVKGETYKSSPFRKIIKIKRQIRAELSIRKPQKTLKIFNFYLKFVIKKLPKIIKKCILEKRG